MSSELTEDLLRLQFLDSIPTWGLYIGAVLLLLLASEVGYRLGRLIQRYRPDRAEASVGALNGATLALMAFLLAFVTSSAVSNFTDRREAVVAEANAIGTTYLRAGYLPDPESMESRQLLREYVDQRLEALDMDKTIQAIARSEEIHTELWALAENLAKEDSSPTLALYLSALNEVIDLHTNRINVALVMRMPYSLLVAVFGMAMLALLLVGVHAGYAEKRNPIALVAFILTVSIVFLLIVDMNRGDSGILRVSQQAMIDLQRQINLP